MYREIKSSLGLTGAHGIVRRYFVVNGFDGALTMLGIIVGFYFSEQVELRVVINACMGASIALAVSGISSAWVSEYAEKKKELRELEQAMVKSLDDSMHGRASRLTPVLIAAVNGLSPLLVSLLVLSPIWIASHEMYLPVAPLPAALVVAVLVMFAFGAYLGKIGGVNWFWAGVRVILIALVTAAIIVVVNKI